VNLSLAHEDLGCLEIWKLLHLGHEAGSLASQSRSVLQQGKEGGLTLLMDGCVRGSSRRFVIPTRLAAMGRPGTTIPKWAHRAKVGARPLWAQMGTASRCAHLCPNGKGLAEAKPLI
jgi:hypothetical protein